MASPSQWIAFVCFAAVGFVSPQDASHDLPVTRLAGPASTVTSGSQVKPSQPVPSPVPGLPVTRIDERRRSAELDAPQRLTLTFSEPANVRDVLLLLVRGTSLSLAVTPDVRGTFVGELKNVTLRQAIESVLTPNGLDYSVDGPIVRVFARRADTRLFDLNFLDVERTWQRAIKDDDAVLTTRVPSGDLLEEVLAGVRALLSDSGRVHVDRRAGLAQVTDFPDRLDRVGAYLETVHLRGSRQVKVQVRVLQVALRSGSSIDWGRVRSRLGIPENSVAAAARVDPAAVQAAVGEQGDARIVASQELLALNSEPAFVRTALGGSAALSLTVVPQISADGIVQLSVSPLWSSQDSAPSLTAADTVVRVTDGSTVMLSGFVQPGERQNPAAGLLAPFATEFVLLFTPTVVTPGAPLSGSR